MSSLHKKKACKTIFKSHKFVIYPELVPYNRYIFKKSYFILEKTYISVFCMPKINFRKSRINEKYQNKFTGSSHYLFLQKHFKYPELGENKA